MDIQESTKQYESWLSTKLDIYDPDLKLKHVRMTESAFSFFRATYYRWAQLWMSACPELTKLHSVLSIGDLHLENFGTWRDLEGRLCWGVNDFDEAYPQPWAADLLRLATSSLVAIAENQLLIGSQKTCKVLLKGYRRSLLCGGKPFVLAEDNEWLRQIATHELRDPNIFWTKLNSLSAWSDPIDSEALALITELLPDSSKISHTAHRVAGLGSLGRHRWVTLANLHGARVAREAKSLAPSAYTWANETPYNSQKIYCQDLLTTAVRIPDPYMKVTGSWVGRRLSPDCSRVGVSILPRRQETKLLESMGFEVGNIHLADQNSKMAILRELDRLPEGWLFDSAKFMLSLVNQDFRDWRKVQKKS